MGEGTSQIQACRTPGLAITELEITSDCAYPRWSTTPSKKERNDHPRYSEIASQPAATPATPSQTPVRISGSSPTWLGPNQVPIPRFYSYQLSVCDTLLCSCLPPLPIFHIKGKIPLAKAPSGRLLPISPSSSRRLSGLSTSSVIPSKPADIAVRVVQVRI